MAGVQDDGRRSPQHRRKPRLWPIPPLARAGTPRGIVNAGPSPDKGRAWRPTAKFIETPLGGLNSAMPTSHASVTAPSHPSAVRPASARLPGKLPGAVWQMAAMQPSLLEALGIQSPAAGETARSGDVWMGRSVPAYNWKDPQECEEGCYWRWLVHALLEDSAALKRNLEDTEESHKDMIEKRNEVDESIGHRNRLLDELERWQWELQSLREEVPRLRQEHEEQQKESHQLARRHRELQEEQRELHARIRRTQEWQKINTRKTRAVEQEAEDVKRQEKDMKEKMQSNQNKVFQLEGEVQDLKPKCQELRHEVRELEEKKAQKRAAAKRAKAAAKGTKK